MRKSKFILAIAIVGALLTICCCANPSGQESSDASLTTSGTNGIVLDVEQFDALCAGGTVDDFEVTPASLALDEILVQEDTLSMQLTLQCADTTQVCTLSGQLFSGVRTGSSVGAMTLDSDTYTVEFFGLFTPESGDHLYVNPALGDYAHFALYLSDTEGRLWLFEDTLPEALSCAETKAENSGLAPEINWYSRYVTPTIEEEIPTTPEILEMMGLAQSAQTAEARSATRWTAGTTHYWCDTNGTDTTEYWSLPYGNYNLQDSAISTQVEGYTATFYISEHTSVNGTTVLTQDNGLRYKNVTFALSGTDGIDIIEYKISGKLMDNSSQVSGDAVVSAVIGTLEGSVSSTTEVLQYLAKAGTETVTLDSFRSPLTYPTLSVMYQTAPLQYLYKHTERSGHSLLFRANIASDCATTTTGTLKLYIIWDVYNNKGVQRADNIYITRSQTYTATP